MRNQKFFEVKGKQTGDYFKFYCSNCESSLETVYLGLDPSISKFRFTCPKCLSSRELKIDRFKINNSGNS
jgi:hypothetical protein